MRKTFNRLVIVLTFTSLFSFTVLCQNETTKKHYDVVIRMIGHKFLISTGDSTSRILPIKHVDNSFQIEFENEFSFYPSQIKEAVDYVMIETENFQPYILEVQNCYSKEIVYSYEKSELIDTSMMPCGERFYQEDCYIIKLSNIVQKNYTNYISIDSLNHPQNSSISSLINNSTTKQGSTSYLLIICSALIILTVILTYLYLVRRRTKTSPNLLSLGDFIYDTKNMTLKLNQDLTELSSKENDLLLLLYSSVNSTVKKEDILKAVWQDEGDYIGRTLDVFISKLRKKLSQDSNIKITNVRGVGYRLIVN
jgi:hypothetical protein